MQPRTTTRNNKIANNMDQKESSPDIASSKTNINHVDNEDTILVTNEPIVDLHGEQGVYTGSLSKSSRMPHGKGRMDYDIVKGQWYEGEWIHGHWSGYGRLSNGEGDLYEGQLQNDNKHGKGVMRFADGRIFEGEYRDGEMFQGKMTYQDGSFYEGSWVDGMRHGPCQCKFADGSEYQGEFRHGQMEGYGKMTWYDGSWYEGEWQDGVMHGRGKEILADGSLRHDGEWIRGQEHIVGNRCSPSSFFS
jgi:hypothetical protein